MKTVAVVYQYILQSTQVLTCFTPTLTQRLVLLMPRTRSLTQKRSFERWTQHFEPETAVLLFELVVLRNPLTVCQMLKMIQESNWKKTGKIQRSKLIIHLIKEIVHIFFYVDTIWGHFKLMAETHLKIVETRQKAVKGSGAEKNSRRSFLEQSRQTDKRSGYKNSIIVCFNLSLIISS